MSLERLPFKALFLSMLLVTAAACLGIAPSARAVPESTPFLPRQTFTVVADRPVCSLLGSVPASAHILGQDGGTSVEADGHVFWGFNDTWVLRPDGVHMLIPNNFAATDDRDASDCISLTSHAGPDFALPSILRINGEVGAFPSGLVSVQPGYVHFFYASGVSDPTTDIQYRIQGFGLGKFSTETMEGERLLGGKFIWGDNSFPGGHLDEVLATTHAAYVYVQLRLTLPGLRAGTMLARTPASALEQANFEYWNGNGWQLSPPDISSEAAAKQALLWVQPIGLSAPSLAYNNFLGKWVAIHTSGYVHLVDAHVADEITGPWTAETAAPVINCPEFLTEPQVKFICYMAQQHEEYEEDGGRTIYVTWSNFASYQVYLHQIRLGRPVYQWSDKQGSIDYGIEAADASYVQDGISFYGSDMPVPGMAAIHRWRDASSGTLRLAPATPGTAFKDEGVAFYAPVEREAADALNALYAPVYLWKKGSAERYSALDLRTAGFVAEERAFYAVCPDSDRDKKSDCHESFKVDGSPELDADGDGLADGFEAKTEGCDPLIPNDDLDGISVAEELAAGTNPCLWDSGFWGCLNAPSAPADCYADTDVDGCADAWELGPNPMLGGRRDPKYEWDYFNPSGDGHNRIDDILTVLDGYFSRPSDDRYSTRLDRGGRSGPNPWNLLPPDGRVLVDDILAAVGAYLNDCP